MWGNDPSLTPAAFASGARPVESVIINPVIGVRQHLGWLRRLNGPIDNPVSACLSCHSTAQRVDISSAVPTGSDARRMRWFRNIKAGDPFDTGQVGLDYSLQLSLGIRRLLADRQAINR